jgi:hypothetical protein
MRFAATHHSSLGRVATNREEDMQKYEYKFVRLGEGWLSVRGEAKHEYQEVIRTHAQEGWRLVQVFAPGIGGYGSAKYYEIILERQV